MKKKFWWLPVISAGIVVTIYGFHLSSKSYSDFAGYYTSSKIIIEADSAALLYNDKWFVNKMHSFGIPDSTFIMYVNPPPSAFVMIPVSWLNPPEAKILWNLINFFLLFTAFYALLKLNNISIKSAVTPAASALFFCTLPYLRNLQRGQIYILLLLFVILFFTGYIQRNTFLSSFSLAVLFLLKYFGWMFFILFIIEKRWKELGFTLAFVIGGFLFMSVLLGTESYQENFKVILDASNQKHFSLTGLPCVPAFFGSLFTYHSQWNTNPILNLPFLSALLTIISLSVMLILSFIKTGINTEVRLSLILILSVIYTPLAADHHYMLLVLPAVYLVQKNYLEFKYSKTIIMVLVLYILLGYYPELKMQAFSGWTKLFAFPRLYAAVIMWVLLQFNTKEGKDNLHMITPID